VGGAHAVVTFHAVVRSMLVSELRLRRGDKRPAEQRRAPRLLSASNAAPSARRETPLLLTLHIPPHTTGRPGLRLQAARPLHRRHQGLPGGVLQHGCVT
jgi:hypothetical protein